MNKKVALHTLGCKLNFAETSTIGNEFLKRNYEIVDFSDLADVYVFNTCTVTENAEKECRQLVRRVLRKNPSAFVVVTGCYAQLRPEEIAKIDGVDAVLGNKEKYNLFSLLNDFHKNELSCIYVGSTDELESFGKAHSTDADGRTRAFFKIQDGCDYKCSFCTIPLARGKSRSMQTSEAVLEFRNLVAGGYKEIILTGVNVGDYNDNGKNLYSLLKEILKTEGEYRIRISSIEPNLLTDEIIDLIANDERLCNHLHIPLQSGSPDILKAMQRRYTVDDFESTIIKAYNKIEDLGIGIDVIVGFPGETEEHFMETYNFVKNLPASYLHVFTYSERPDTKALTFDGTVEIQERKRRNRMLRNLSTKKQMLFYNKMIGKELNVIFEDENHAGKMKGFASNYVRVITSYDKARINKISPVTIAGLNSDGFCTIKDMNKAVDLITSLK